jgi:hypothetical protein
MSDTQATGLPTSETGSVVVTFRQGEYHYYIHQTANQYDLGLTSSLGIIENGILISLGTSSNLTFFTESNDDTIRVFREY